MNYPKVFVIILNYNGKDILLNCLNSVYQLDYSNFEVVVVDNNSTDSSFEEARKKFSKAHFIKNNKNLGFSAGNNIAIRWALEKMADYVFLLNNDALIEKSSLKKMINIAERDSKARIFSPIIYNGKSKDVWFDGGNIDWLKMRTTHNTCNAKCITSRATSYVTGCAMLIKKEVFKKIGLFDEDYFLYYEDADFSWRARKAGLSLKIIPEAKVYHFEKSSENPNKMYWLVYSGLLFFKKNAPIYWRPWIFIYTFLRKAKNKKNLKNKEKYSVDIKKAFEDFKNFGK